MLKIDALTKQFGDKTAVDAVNISVEKPTMIGIIGRSGAGKSTLLRMVNRLSDATGGTIMFDGKEITALRGAAKRELAVTLRDDLSAVQSGAPHGCSIKRSARDFEQTLDLCDDVQPLSATRHTQSHRDSRPPGHR